MNARDSRVFKSGETSQTARPSAACLMRRNLTRGRIAPTLRVKELLQPTGSGSPTTVTPVTEQLSSLNFGPLLSEEYLSRRAKLLVNEQMKEPPLGSVVTRGAPDVVISKKEMTRRFVATRAALFDAEEGKELQQRVWGVLMNKFALRLLVLGPPSSGKRKAVMTVGAQLRHLGIVIVVSYGKKRIQELIDSVRFVPPADLKPHWRGYGANFIVLNPDCLHDVSHKLSEVSMLIVDMFDQLIDFGLEGPVMDFAEKLSPNIYLVVTARTPSKRLFKFTEQLQLTAQVEVVSSPQPEASLPGRCFDHRIVNFLGERKQAIQEVLGPIEHGTKLIILFAKSAKEANQLSEILEDQGICDAWSLHSPDDEVRGMAMDHLVQGQCALYIAIESDRESLLIFKGKLDMVINMRPAECEQVITFRSALLKPGATMVTLNRLSSRTGVVRNKVNEVKTTAE